MYFPVNEEVYRTRGITIIQADSTTPLSLAVQMRSRMTDIRPEMPLNGAKCLHEHYIPMYERIAQECSRLIAVPGNVAFWCVLIQL